MGYNWDFATVLGAWPLLLRGLLGTLELFSVTVVCGFCFGLFVGFGRYARSPWANVPASMFVEFFRNTPVLVQIIWFYFAFPMIVPFQVNAFMAAVLGMSLNTAAFTSDIFRGGIQSIDWGQWEGGRAIGMREAQIMRRIILPQALKRMLPALTNRGIEAFKMSTLASVLAFGETLYEAKTIATENFNPIETYTIVALLFFAVLYPVVQLTYVLERQLRQAD
jgi:polar amino acid transport system permease protein